MAAIKPQIRSLFATPLCVHFLPVATETNAALRPMLLERTREAVSRGQGAYAKDDFRHWGNHHAETLLSVVTDLADSLTASRSGGRVKAEWRIVASAAMRIKGEYQQTTSGRPLSGRAFISSMTDMANQTTKHSAVSANWAIRAGLYLRWFRHN